MEVEDCFETTRCRNL